MPCSGLSAAVAAHKSGHAGADISNPKWQKGLRVLWLNSDSGADPKEKVEGEMDRSFAT